MIKARQPRAGQRSLAEVGFRNPDRRLGIEVVRYAQLIDRLSDRLRNGVHRTVFHQLFVIVRGTAVMSVDFVDHACEPGTVVHAHPGQTLTLPRPQTPQFNAVAVLFTPAFPSPHPQIDRLLGPRGTPAWHPGGAERRALLSTTRELETGYRELLRPGPSSELAAALVRQLLGVLLLRLSLLAGDPAHDPATAHESVARFLAELEHSYATTRNAGQYAQRLGYSARTLDRACVAATGHTAKQLIDARVSLEAKRLLAHTSLPASTISQRLGFAQATNFQKFFARHTGETPSSFRTSTQTPPSTS